MSESHEIRALQRDAALLGHVLHELMCGFADQDQERIRNVQALLAARRHMDVEPWRGVNGSPWQFEN